MPGPGHGLLTGRYACYDTYPTGDDQWLAVAAIEPRFWANLCQALGLEQWTSHQHDDDVQDEIRADLRQVFAARSRDEWVELLGPADTCVSPVLSVPEVVTDPQFVSRRAFVDATHPDHGSFRQVAPTLAGQVRADSYDVRPADVTDTDALLQAAGLSTEECTNLRESGVIA